MTGGRRHCARLFRSTANRSADPLSHVPPGNKIHERHDREVKIAMLLEPDSCFKGESEQVTEASDLISDRIAITVCHNTLSTSTSTRKNIRKTPQAVSLRRRDPTRKRIQLQYIGAHKQD